MRIRIEINTDPKHCIHVRYLSTNAWDRFVGSGFPYLNPQEQLCKSGPRPGRQMEKTSVPDPESDPQGSEIIWPRIRNYLNFSSLLISKSVFIYSMFLQNKFKF